MVADAAFKEEVKGEPWYLGDTYITAIGQGDMQATPLQVANMTRGRGKWRYSVPSVSCRACGLT